MPWPKIVYKFLVVVFLLMPTLCLAEWQTQNTNGYTWYLYQDGNSKAFWIPTGVGTYDYYYQWYYPNGVVYQHPMANANPQLDMYYYYWADTQNNTLQEKQDNQQWVNVVPDLAGVKNIRDAAYLQFVNNSGKSDNVLYYAYYNEWDLIYRISLAIAERNSGGS